MKRSRLLGAVCAAVVSFVTLSSHATLHGILPATPGGSDWQAYYDDVADLTWLANANAAVGSSYDTFSSGTGLMTWNDANAWAVSLNINGITGWRLPTTLQPDSSCQYQAGPNDRTSYGYDCTGSEMGNLFYNVLGGVAGSSITTTHNSNYDLFSHVQSAFYWASTEYAPVAGHAWGFFIENGYQAFGNTISGEVDYAWAVHDGDVGTNPVITAVGGDLQECAQSGGTEIDFTASGPSSLSPGETVVEYQWILDGESVGNGQNTKLFISLGKHLVEVVATISTGETRPGLKAKAIEIVDTTDPVINTAFIDSKTGSIITSVNHKADVEVSIEPSDVCDPAPTYTSGLGIPVRNLDVVNISSKKDLSIELTNASNSDNVMLNVVATDASGNVSSKSVLLPVSP